MTPQTLFSPMRRILKLAFPVVISQLGLMSMGVVDIIMIGNLAPEALAGVALGNYWSFAWVAFGVGTATGLDPALTQAWGAKDGKAFDSALAHGALLLLMLLPAILGLHWVAEPGLRMLGQPEHALQIAGAYTRIVGFSAPAMLGFAFLRQATQARGVMWLVTWVAIAANVVHIPLNYWLVSHMGPMGVAWATTAVRWLMLACLAFLLPNDVQATLRGLQRVTGRGVATLAALAIPVSLQMCLEIWGFTAAGMMVGHFGEDALGAHSVVLNLAAVSYMIPIGISAASATIIGNHVGASENWRPSAVASLLCAALIMLLPATVLYTWPDPIIAIYVPHDPGVSSIALTLIPIVALFQVFDGLQGVGFGVLRGLGDTRFPAVISITGLWLFGLPLGHHLASTQQFGPRGIWMGMATALLWMASGVLARIGWLSRRSQIVRVQI